MCADDRCVLCDSGEVDVVKHFLHGRMRGVRLGEAEAAGENWSDGGITRVVGGELKGRGRRKDGFAAGKKHRGRSGSWSGRVCYRGSAEVVAEVEGASIWQKSPPTQFPLNSIQFHQYHFSLSCMSSW